MMKQDNLISAVNAIHASAQLKDKVLSGRTSQRDKKPIGFTVFRCAACLMAVLAVGMGVRFAPEILKQVGTTAPASQAAVSSGSGQPGYVNGLYHDDAVTNILLLGVDNYQKGDIGRSDSMMLVSVDTRHKKLKVTSFQRDMYVAIPEHGSNRLNTAYSTGGPALSVSAIETNFGIDIDRYAVIEYSAFDQIIDKLGGVNVTLSASEAKLVNQYSGDSRRNLSAGTFTLSGAQAHYYSRIRAIGDDFERTQRQRKVFSSIVAKLKTSNIGTVNQELYDILPLVTTNMTKNEVLSMTGNALAYLNFPVSQNRVPADNAYTSEKVTISGLGADVLVPELAKNKQVLIQFIYEKDIALS